MKITEQQFENINQVCPKQRGNVRIRNIEVVNAILYMAENGGSWRDLPDDYGNWNSIYRRVNRWANNGTIDRVFQALEEEKILTIVSTEEDGSWPIRTMTGIPRFDWNVGAESAR